MCDGIVKNLYLLRTEKLVNTLHRIALLALLTLSGATLADAPAPVPAPAPAAKPVPKPKTHTITVDGKPKVYFNLPGAPVASDSSAAYQYRTRILVSPPSCQRFATDADNAFLSGTLDEATKTAQLKKIGADAAAAGCLGP
ncbi:MAG: hypothetical protein WC540_09250 [Sulfuritalea sp.]